MKGEPIEYCPCCTIVYQCLFTHIHCNIDILSIYFRSATLKMLSSPDKHHFSRHHVVIPPLFPSIDFSQHIIANNKA